MQKLSRRTILEIRGRDKLWWGFGLRLVGIVYDKLLETLGASLQFCILPLDRQKRFSVFWSFLQREVITLANLITLYGIFLLYNLIYASYLWVHGDPSPETYSLIALWTGSEPGFLRLAFYQLLEIFLTDFIDGPAARLNQRVSALGTFLDHYRDYQTALFALVLLVTVTIREGDGQMAIFEFFALLGLLGILWYFGKMLWIKYWDTDFVDYASWPPWIKERSDFLRNFALNEYQTELSGRIQFFVVAFTVCAGIFHYSGRTVFSSYAFIVSMAVNLLVTGGYFNETYNLYERLHDLLKEKAARFKERVAVRKEISAWWWVPNALSIFRGLSPIPLFFLFPSYPLTSLVLLSAASMSDLADGAIARWKRVESPPGRWLDPLADKTLYLGTLWILRGYTWVSVVFWFTLPAELALMLIRVSWIRKRIGTQAPAKLLGKTKAWIHFSGAYAVMRGALWGGENLYLDAGSVLVFMGCILSYLSLADHLNLIPRKTPS